MADATQLINLAFLFSLRSVSVIAGVLGRAGENGQKRRLADAARGIVTWYAPSEVRRFLRSEAAKAKNLAQEQADARRSNKNEGEQSEDALFQDGDSGKDDLSGLMEQIRL